MVRKKRTFLAVFRIITLFVMGLLIAVVVALSQVNLDTLRGNIVAVLSDAVGVPVEIAGDVSWKFSLRPRIELNKLRIKNPDWAKHEYAFKADKIDVTLNLISLFQDRPTIQNLKVYNAELCIEKNENGDLSLGSTDDKSQKKETRTGKYPFEDPGLGGLEIKNLKADIFGEDYKLKGLQIHYVSVDDAREYAGWLRTSKSILPFIVSFSEYNEERKVYPVKIAFSSDGDALIANVALEGTSKLPIDFIIKGDVPDVEVLGELFKVDLSGVPSMYLNLVGGVDRKKISFRKSSIKVEDSKINFSGELNWTKKMPVLALKIQSDNVDLPTMCPYWYNEKSVRPNRELNVFKDIPLFGKEVLKQDLDLDISLKNFIVYEKFNIKDLNVKLKTASGRGRLDITTSLASGSTKISSDFDIDVDGRYYLKVAGKGENIVVGQILSELNYNDIISDLPSNFETYLEASGTDLAGVMKTLTGPVKVYSVNEGYAYSKLVSNIYGTDFLTSLRHSLQDLFSSNKKYDQMTISCVTVNTKFRNGVAETENGVAVETNAINVRLAGLLDFANEKIKMSLITVPVRGLKLSLTGNVVNSIEITGNLAEPSIQISGAAVAGKVASATGIGLLLAPFTGGIGLVAGTGVGLLAGDFLENWLADDHPCRTAMEKGAPARRDDPAWMNEDLNLLMNQVFEVK